MKTSQVVNLLLSKEEDIISKIHYAVGEVIRNGYETNRGKEEVVNLVNSIIYSLEEMQNLLSKGN